MTREETTFNFKVALIRFQGGYASQKLQLSQCFRLFGAIVSELPAHPRGQRLQAQKRGYRRPTSVRGA